MIEIRSTGWGFQPCSEDEGIEPIKRPYQAPNPNAHTERLVRSIEDECLSLVILFAETHFLIHRLLLPGPLLAR